MHGWPQYPGFDTLALHAGQSPDPATGSRAVPIYRPPRTSSAYQHAPRSSTWSARGHVYSRISNPTVAVLEERMAALEGASRDRYRRARRRCIRDRHADGRGQPHRRLGSLYVGSHNLLAYTLKRFGIATTFVTPRDLEAWGRATGRKRACFFGETLGNPGLDVLDFRRGRNSPRDKSPLLVDATFTTPYLMQPSRSARICLSLRPQVPGRPRRRDRRRAGRTRACSELGRLPGKRRCHRIYRGFHHDSSGRIDQHAADRDAWPPRNLVGSDRADRAEREGLPSGRAWEGGVDQQRDFYPWAISATAGMSSTSSPDCRASRRRAGAFPADARPQASSARRDERRREPKRLSV